MIFQNLINNKPKTFMDYEPGKVPAKKEWASLSEAQTQPKNIFESNIKLVGDDMTEKDYDAFFDGFRSANDEPAWKWKTSTPKLKMENIVHKKPEQIRVKPQSVPYSPISGGELKPQIYPYRPSEHGEPKPQTFPYRPSEHGEAKIVQYSATPVTYAQKKNSSSEPKETLWDKAWDKIKEPFEDGKNLLNELSRIYDDLSPESKAAMKTVLNPLSDSDSREEAGKVLENEIKRIHYGRNQYNVDLPRTEEIAKDWKWETEMANCHQFTADGERYVKYVSPDGKREVIFNENGDRVITADEDVGTYNYADPDLGIAHTIVDILPWLVYGNTPEDTTEWYQRIGGLFKFGN